MEDYLEKAVKEKGQRQDDYQDIHRILSVDQAKQMKRLEEENSFLKQQVMDLTLKIENLSCEKLIP